MVSCEACSKKELEECVEGDERHPNVQSKKGNSVAVEGILVPTPSMHRLFSLTPIPKPLF